MKNWPKTGQMWPKNSRKSSKIGLLEEHILNIHYANSYFSYALKKGPEAWRFIVSFCLIK